MRHRTNTSFPESMTPVPGYWYINAKGKLIQVRLVTYDGSIPTAALIQYIDGSTQAVDIDDWHGLDILMPAGGSESRRCETDRYR